MGSGVATRFYERWFDQTISADADVSYSTLGWDLCGLAIAGPQARTLLGRLTTTDVSTEAFRFMDFRRLDLGPVPVWCGRVSFSGDLGYEFWMSSSRQRSTFDLLMRRGEDLGLRLFGLHALLVAAHGAGPERRLLTWTVDTAPGRNGADVIDDEPVWYDGDVVGWITSGGYSTPHGPWVTCRRPRRCQWTIRDRDPRRPACSDARQRLSLGPRGRTNDEGMIQP